MSLTQARLFDLVSYDQETGVFIKKTEGRMGHGIGSVVGSDDGLGYLQVRLDGKVYRLHRLAFLYMTGEMPVHHVDHLNGSKADNRWTNLRDCPRKTNAQNIRLAKSSNKSGLLGVCFVRGKWLASITVNRKHQFLGYHETPELAHSAYVQAKRRLHSGCTI